MNHQMAVWVTFLSVATLAGADPLTSNGPNFTRREDPVIIRGACLGPLTGRPIEDLRLYTRHSGEIVPVPFQIDKRAPDGGYLYPYVRRNAEQPWRDNPAWPAHTGCGPEDELVFLARDAGDRLHRDDLPVAGDVVEIALRDPADGAQAYVYLAAPGAEAPQASARYVRFDPNQNLVISDELSYGQLDPPHPSVFNYLTVGGSGNLMQRLGLDLRVEAFFGRVSMDRGAEDVELRTIAYSEGPVRVLYLQQSRIGNVFWMQREWIERVFVNYPTRIEIPNRFRVPFRPGLLITSAYAEIMLVLTDATLGSYVWHPSFPAGVELKPGQEGGSAELAPGRIEGLSLLGAFGGLVFHLQEDPQARDLRLARRFLCRQGPAADSPFEVGIRFAGIEHIPRGTYEFKLIVSGRRDFQPGDEKEFQRIEAQPLEISSTPLLLKAR